MDSEVPSYRNDLCVEFRGESRSVGLPTEEPVKSLHCARRNQLQRKGKNKGISTCLIIAHACNGHQCLLTVFFAETVLYVACILKKVGALIHSPGNQTFVIKGRYIT